jgi:hypothetical protein
MGVERITVSAKLSLENMEFLDELAHRLRPYEVSQSSLVNTLVRIVRQLEATGKISLEPKQLQTLLTTDRSEIVAATLRRGPRAERATNRRQK